MTPSTRWGVLCWAAATMFAGLSIAGCGSGRTVGAGVTTAAPPTLAADVQPIFTARCAFSGCHAGSSPQQGMDLSAGNAQSHVVNVDSAEVPTKKRVLPGDVANSYLFEKISQDTPTVGDRMPRGGAALPTAELETIREWIRQGARS